MKLLQKNEVSDGPVRGGREDLQSREQPGGGGTLNSGTWRGRKSMHTKLKFMRWKIRKKLHNYHMY